MHDSNTFPSDLPASFLDSLAEHATNALLAELNSLGVPGHILDLAQSIDGLRYGDQAWAPLALQSLEAVGRPL